ncbi:hypothetical protein [Wukongibacter sp. M2B1]|uniref:hypothetical protein n=1 Tax=Wukongibacter sp. M2B1 TaxID=3088895 RepID=UPI003D78FFFC
MFSSLFIINKSLIDKCFYLDIFINETYNFFAFRISKTMSEIKNDFISDLYRFEVEAMRISSGKNIEQPETHIFDYDMLLYYQNFEKKKEKCKLLFSLLKIEEFVYIRGICSNGIEGCIKHLYELI